MRKFACFLTLVVLLLSANDAWAAPQAEPHPKRVAILLFDGAEIIDYSGPWEVFGAAGYDVFAVAKTKAPITTAGGEVVVPNYDFSNAPEADILLVPGGDVSKVRKDSQTLAWIRKVTAHDQHTLSVCNGAMTLADSGLLDGLSATATYWWIPKLRAGYPKIHVVDDKRWVDNGKIITAAGLSAGIDGALHLVEVLDGRGTAQSVALALEYNWQPEGGFARAALADAQIPKIDIDSLGQWHVNETNGDRSHWVMRVEGASTKSAAEIQDFISHSFTERGHWVQDAGHGDSRGLTHWHFADQHGKHWTATLAVAPVEHASGRLTIAITVQRLA